MLLAQGCCTRDHNPLAAFFKNVSRKFCASSNQNARLHSTLMSKALQILPGSGTCCHAWRLQRCTRNCRPVSTSCLVFRQKLGFFDMTQGSALENSFYPKSSKYVKLAFPINMTGLQKKLCTRKGE